MTDESIPHDGPVPQQGEERGLFGVEGTGDTSGFGGLVRHDPKAAELVSTPKPYGGYFDELVDTVKDLMGDDIARAGGGGPRGGAPPPPRGVEGLSCRPSCPLRSSRPRHPGRSGR
jgi:hypothetical protein